MCFIGVLFNMVCHLLPNIEHYWWVSDGDEVDTQVGKFMSKNMFKRTLECFKLPKDDMGSDNTWGDYQTFFYKCTKS